MSHRICLQAWMPAHVDMSHPIRRFDSGAFSFQTPAGTPTPNAQEQWLETSSEQICKLGTHVTAHRQSPPRNKITMAGLQEALSNLGIGYENGRAFRPRPRQLRGAGIDAFEHGVTVLDLLREVRLAGGSWRAYTLKTHCPLVAIRELCDRDRALVVRNTPPLYSFLFAKVPRDVFLKVLSCLFYGRWSSSRIEGGISDQWVS